MRQWSRADECLPETGTGGLYDSLTHVVHDVFIMSETTWLHEVYIDKAGSTR